MLFLATALVLLLGSLVFWTDDPDDEEDHGSDDDALRGTSGDDTLTGTTGLDRILAGDGNDTILAENETTVFGGAGDDDVTAGENAFVSGDLGDDTLSAGGFSTVDGGAGDDTIFGGGDSVINGGAGNDTIAGFNILSTIDGGTGNDTIEAAAGAVITLGEGNDVVSLNVDLENPGDSFNAGLVQITDYVAGEDRFELTGAFRLDPETGAAVFADEVAFRETEEGVLVSIEGISFIFLQGRTLDEIDPDDFTIIGPQPGSPTDGPARITGDDGPEEFTVGPNTVLEALGGDDTALGQDSTSTLFGGDGNDSLAGEGVMHGDAGDDLISAGFRSEAYGGDGNDTILSGLETTIDGGAGDDDISSLAGDVVTLGEGEDIFRLEVAPNNASDIFNSGLVRVTDYTPGEDVYVLTGAALFDQLPPTEVIGVGELSFAQAGEDVEVRIADIPFIILQDTDVDDVVADDFVVLEPIVTPLEEPVNGFFVDIRYPDFPAAAAEAMR